MMWVKILAGLGLAISMLPGNAFAEASPQAPVAQASAPAMLAPNAAPAVAKVAPATAQPVPFRTWITLENFEMIANGDPSNPISNVRLEVTFPGGKKMEFPGEGQYWTIGNGQKQDIKKTFEIPWQVIANDGFAFSIQMVRRGSNMLPCNFNVTMLSQYNRSYFCHTDLQWQMDQKYKEEKLDKEGIQVRVWTDRNTPVKEQPKDALALR